MKKITQKILTGILSLVIVLGCFGGLETLEVKAVYSPLKVTVVDENEQPVKGLKMQFSGSTPLIPGVTEGVPETDENGVFTCEVADVSGLRKKTTYLLQPASDSGYACSSNATKVEIGDNTPLKVNMVNGEEYKRNSKVKLIVKAVEIEKKPTITSVTTQEFIDENGGQVEVTVAGENLPDSLYCQRIWFKELNHNAGVYTRLEAESISLTGSDTSKTFSVNIPASLGYPDAVAWKVGVGLTEAAISAASDKTTTGFIKISGATKEELQGLVDGAKNKNSEDYGPDSWKEYSDAIGAGEALLTKDSALLSEYAAAIDRIEKALTDLQNNLIPSSEKVHTFKIKVLDEKGGAVSAGNNVKFQLVKTDDRNDVHALSLEDDGVLINDDTIKKSGFYWLELTEDSGLECVQTITVQIAEGDVSKKMYIADVRDGSGSMLNDHKNDKEYEPTVNIRKASENPRIIGVSTEITDVTNKGQVTVKVNGRYLPSELYYYLSYTESAESDRSRPYNNSNRVSVPAAGAGDKEKTITVTLPEKPQNAYAWKINVAVSDMDTAYPTGTIRIVEEAARGELQAAIDAFGAKKSSDYTPESWEVYNSAIEEGKKVLATDSATNFQYGVALADIREAEEELFLKTAANNHTLKIKAVDEEGEPAAKILFEIKTNFSSLYFSETKENGTASYSMNGMSERTGQGNKISLMENGKYECDIPMSVDFVVNSDSNYYIRKFIVDGKKVEAGQEAVITVKKILTKETMAKLNAAIKDAAKLKEADYTPASWKVYKEALEAAKAVTKKEKASETDYKKALKALNDAKAALVVKSSGTKVYKVTKIKITGISKKVAVGKKIRLTASVLPSNASNKAVKWTTSNKKYATVDSKGKVSVKKAGAGRTVTITATAADGSGVKATYKIRIQKHAVKSIKLKAKKTVKAGKSLKVKATVKTTGKKANKALKWTSSNTKYATVSSKGVVKAKKAGKGRKVKITASATDGSGKKKTVTIKIK